jgi:Pentapeptide repeats (8 copies)
MDQQQQSRWQPTRRQLLWAGVAVALMIGAVLIGYRYGVTLWDWIKLLIVPAVIAGGGIWFNRQQRERELEIAERRAQDEALQAYLDKMTELLVVHKLGKPDEGDNVRTVAWARTKTVLRRLDSSNQGAVHKGAVLRFLNEAELIRTSGPVIRSLSGADLRGANLQRSYLKDVALRGVDLSSANLSGANLSGACLGRSEDTNRPTDLTDADLSGADLSGATVTKQQLAQAESLEGATMPNGQKYEDWLKSKDRGENG